VIRWSQERIHAWARATFGPSTAMDQAARMNVEVTELLTDLGDGVDPLLDALLKANMQMAEAISARVHQLTAQALPPDHQFRSPGAARGKEAPDILVMVYQVASMCGVPLLKATDAKMDINEKRTWVKLASGRHQHA
jgi:hypothetical protein